MIKLKLSDNQIEMFNLKNFEREKAFYCAWASMQGFEDLKNKLFRITTDTGKKLELRLGQISECMFDESHFIQIKPSNVRMGSKKVWINPHNKKKGK